MYIFICSITIIALIKLLYHIYYYYNIILSAALLSFIIYKINTIEKEEITIDLVYINY